MAKTVSSTRLVKLLLASALLLICSLPGAQAQVCTPGATRWVPTTACCENGTWTWYSQEHCWNGQFWMGGKISMCNPADPCG